MPNNMVTRFFYVLWCWGLLAGVLVWRAVLHGVKRMVGTERE